MSHLKTCSQCGRQVDWQKNFCPQCGSSEFIGAGNDPETRQPDAPKKKGLQWWHILIIVIGLAIVVLLAVLVVLTVKGDKKDSADNAKDDKAVVADADEDKDDEDKKTDEDKDEDPPDETTTKREETTKREVAYTKGELVGDVYTNEWADLQVVIPYSYYDLTDEWNAMATDNVDWGLEVFPSDGSSFSRISISFEKLSSDHEYDDESYLEKLLADIGKVSTYEIQGDPTTAIIAGHTYTKVVVREFDTIENIYFRILDDYVVFIELSGESEVLNDATASIFTPVE